MLLTQPLNVHQTQTCMQSPHKPDRRSLIIADHMTMKTVTQIITISSTSTLKSTFLAIFLEWGTAGAAVMAMYLTSTRGEIITSDRIQLFFISSPSGLGCHSGSQLLYAVLSTVIWLFSAMSGMLAHNLRHLHEKPDYEGLRGYCPSHFAK
jgi:hypothetical protein